MRYCVYFHVNPVAQEVFYVGKGKNSRPQEEAKRSQFWRNVAEKDFAVILIHENLSEEEAFKYEKEYIKQIGRRDLGLGTLVNLTDGGEGYSGPHSAEHVKAIVAARKRNNKPTFFTDPESRSKNISAYQKTRIGEDRKESWGKKQTAERIQHRVDAITGKKRNETQRHRMQIAALNRERKECQCCKKTFASSQYTRHIKKCN